MDELTDEQFEHRVLVMSLDECRDFIDPTDDVVLSPALKEAAYKHLAGQCNCPDVYLLYSFSEPGKFLGAAFVKCKGFSPGVHLTHRLGFNPGGSILSSPVERGRYLPLKYLNRLLTREQLDKAGNYLMNLDPATAPCPSEAFIVKIQRPLATVGEEMYLAYDEGRDITFQVGVNTPAGGTITEAYFSGNPPPAKVYVDANIGADGLLHFGNVTLPQEW